MYEREIAQNSQGWPGAQANLARALIWLQMGENAASVPTADQRKNLPHFLRDLADMPDPLKPGPESCFEKALELEPKLLEAHSGLFRYHTRAEHTAKAIKAGRRLLELFPDHLQTMEELADLYGHEGKHNEELELLQQALRHNPLDRADLRRTGDSAMRTSTRARPAVCNAKVDQFDKARPHYESALSYAEPQSHGFLSCCWAACEMKAENQSRADELLAQARAKAPGEMLLTYVLLVESIRLKLPHAIKTRFTKEFNEAVGDKPTPALAVALLEYLGHLQSEDVTYHGQKTHTKKLYDFVDRLDKKCAGPGGDVHCHPWLPGTAGPASSDDDSILRARQAVVSEQPVCPLLRGRPPHGRRPRGRGHPRQRSGICWTQAGAVLGRPAARQRAGGQSHARRRQRPAETAAGVPLDDAGHLLACLVASRGGMGGFPGGIRGFPRFEDLFDPLAMTTKVDC